MVLRHSGCDVHCRVKVGNGLVPFRIRSGTGHPIRLATRASPVRYLLTTLQVRQHMPDKHLGVVDLPLHGWYGNFVVHQKRARGYVSNIAGDR